MTKLFAFSLLIFLCGCTAVQPITTLIGHPMTWEERSTALNHIQAWTVKGSVSIQHTQKTDLASLQWDQQNDRYRFALFGPLGFGRVTITGQPGRIALTQSNKPPILAATPELLMQNQLGWQIPVSYLYYWVRGLSAPDVPAVTIFDAYHHLIKLKQAQWEIEYPEYMPVGKVDLPRKIQMMSKKLKIKLTVREWVK